MATTTETKYEEIVDEMAESIARHLESLPEPERNRRLKAIAAYSFDTRKPRQNCAS